MDDTAIFVKKSQEIGSKRHNEVAALRSAQVRRLGIRHGDNARHIAPKSRGASFNRAGNAIPRRDNVKVHHGTSLAVINCGNVMVCEGQDLDSVTDVVRPVGDMRATKLFLLIDNASNRCLDSQLPDLRLFINSQLTRASIGSDTCLEDPITRMPS